MANGGNINYIINVNGSSAVNNINRISSAFQNLQSVGTKLAGLGAALTASVTAPILAAVKAGISFDSAMEQAQSGFATMLGSAEKATAMVGKLKAMADSTPFEMTDLMDSAKTMLAFGQTAESILPSVNMLGDVAMGNKEKFKSLSLAYAQVQATGRLMGQDLLQMVNAGFNPLQVIAEKTGISMGELKEKMEKGGISAETVTKTFQAATSSGGRFYKAMDTASKTFEGQMSTLSDTVKTALGTIVKPLFDMLTNEVIPALTQKLKQLQSWFESLSPTVKKVVLIVGLLLASLGPLLLIIGGLIMAFSAVAGVISAIEAPVIIAVVAIAALVAALIYLWNTSEQFRQGVTIIWDYIASKIESVINYIGQLWNQYGVVIIEAMMLAWEAFIAFMQPILDYFAKLFVELWQNLQPVFAAIMDLFKALGELFMALWDLVSPIIKAIGVVLWALLGTVVSVFSGLVKALAPALKFIVDGLTSLVYVLKAAAQALTGDFGGAWDSLKQAGNSAKSMWTDLGNTVSGTIEGFKGGADAYADGTLAAIDKINGGMGKLKEDWAKSSNGTMPTPGQFTGNSALTFKPITLPRINTDGAKADLKQVDLNAAKLGDTVKTTAIDFSKLGDEADKTGSNGESAMEELADKMKDVTKEIVDQTKSFSGFVGLFDKVQRSGTGSGASLTNRLRKQVEEMKQWSQALSTIQGKLGGGNDDFMNELRKMGAGSAKQIIGLSRLDEGQLKEYANLFGQKQNLAWQEAKQVVQFEHSGTIIVRGVDMAGETKEIASIVAQDLAANSSRYSKQPAANKAFK